VYPKQCPELFKLLLSKKISAEDKELLVQSQCGNQPDGIKPLLCCPKENPKNYKWLESLKKKLPQPPNCGMIIDDRIVGGEVVPVGRLPWTVLLEYTRRKLD
jgi:hypothetical protein